MKNLLSALGVVLAGLLIAAFVFLAARGLADPATASARFGEAATDAAGQFYYRVYLSRNLVIVLAAAAFLVLRRWRPLAILMTLVILLPLFDIFSLRANGTQPPVFHYIALAWIVVTSVLLWIKARAEGK
jgi:predicted signal transduction protein with EAL and GGDEF domain